MQNIIPECYVSARFKQAAVSANIVRQDTYLPTNEFMAHISLMAGDTALKMMTRSGLYANLGLRHDAIDEEVARCHGCHLAALEKGNKKHHDAVVKRDAKWPGQVLYSDLMGPVVPLGIGRARFLLVVVDEYSRYTFACPLQNKAQAPKLVAEIIEHINTHVANGVYVDKKGKSTCGRVQVLYTDQGGEYMSHALETFVKARGIKHDTTAKGQSESNGVAERAIGVIQRHVRSILLPSNLTHRLWPEAAMTAAQASNLVPHSGIESDFLKDHVRESRQVARRAQTSAEGKCGAAGWCS